MLSSTHKLYVGVIRYSAVSLRRKRWSVTEITEGKVNAQTYITDAHILTYTKFRSVQAVFLCIDGILYTRAGQISYIL